MSGRATESEPAGRPDGRPRRRRRRWVRVLVVVVAVLAALLLAAPYVVSPFAAGLAARYVNDRIHGRVEIEAVSVGWFGATEVRFPLDVSVVECYGEAT